MFTKIYKLFVIAYLFTLVVNDCSSASSSSARHVFHRTPMPQYVLTVLTGQRSEIVEMNDHREMIAIDEVEDGPQNGIIYENGRQILLDHTIPVAISGSGEILATANPPYDSFVGPKPGNPRAILWVHGKRKYLCGSKPSEAVGMDTDGNCYVRVLPSQYVEWHNGSLRAVESLPNNLISNARNSHNQAIFPNFRSPLQTFVKRNGRLFDLNNCIPPSCGWIILSTYAINNHGQIVAIAMHGSTHDEDNVLLTPTIKRT